MNIKLEFNKLKNEFQLKIKEWEKKHDLISLSCYKNADYKIIRTLVYNTQLDNILPEDIKVVLVGDNPGMKEQEQNAYLVGKSGKMAANFFKQVYGYNFYKNVIILNKTPIHTKSTQQLKEIHKHFLKFLEETQRYMATLIYRLAILLNVPVFITGFAGCRRPDGTWLYKSKNGYNLNTQTAPFFFEQLRISFANNAGKLFLFKHFSYGNFSRDLKPLLAKKIAPKIAVHQIGQSYTKELLSRPK